MKKMDGAGLAKMQTLDEAVTQISHIHSIVERMAMAIRASHDTSGFRGQIARAGAPLVGLLKGQFGMVSEQVSAMILVLTRGGGEQARLRALREYVAQIRTALEISIAKVKEQHLVDDSAPKPEA
jgi:hypothetical protein